MTRFACAMVVALVAVSALDAQAPVTVRLGSMIPAGTIWSTILKEQAAQWPQLTSGRVRLVLNLGTQGDEDAIIRKMRTSNQLQAASLSAIGLGTLDPAFNVFSIPMFFENYDELHHVMAKVEPLVRARLDQKGFVFLNWGSGGWVQVFSKMPIRSLKDAKSAKLFTSAGDDGMVQWYKANGFQPVPLSAPDMLPALTTGMVEAIPATPLTAISFQWYKRTPYMLDIGLAPFIGATIVARKSWDSISAADQAALVTAAARIEGRFRTDVPKTDAESVAVMQKSGLTVVKADPPAVAEFRTVAEGFAKTMRDGLIPKDVFDVALAERDAFRKGRAARK